MSECSWLFHFPTIKFKTRTNLLQNGLKRQTDHDRPTENMLLIAPKSLSSLLAYYCTAAPSAAPFSRFVLWVGQIHRFLSTLSLPLPRSPFFKSQRRRKGKEKEEEGAKAAKPWLNQTEPTNPTCTSQRRNFLVRYLIPMEHISKP